MKKILILGSAGMLGHVVYTYLNEVNKYELFNASFPNKFRPDSILLDATNKEQVEVTINKIKPDIIINCIGILIKGSQKDPSSAIYLNSFLPHQLSKLCFNHGGKLIHISTDCVFSGAKGNYSEDDHTNANDVYGRSKALGEVVNDRDLTIRTSIIGPELKKDGEGLFHWFMNQTGTIKGYTQALWSGVTTLEVAKAIDVAIEQNVKGLIHLTNGEIISKFELLNLLKQVWEKSSLTIIPDNCKALDKSLLRSAKFEYTVPSYMQMLIEQFEWVGAHEEMYEGQY
jgi:dTDP-4-dehydrorhamnose reductase